MKARSKSFPKHVELSLLDYHMKRYDETDEKIMKINK